MRLVEYTRYGTHEVWCMLKITVDNTEIQRSVWKPGRRWDSSDHILRKWDMEIYELDSSGAGQG